jgi:hypothetical protein
VLGLGRFLRLIVRLEHNRGERVGVWREQFAIRGRADGRADGRCPFDRFRRRLWPTR